MLGWCRRKGITSFLLMLGCSLGLGCIPTTTEQPEPSKIEQPEPPPKVSVSRPTPASLNRQYTIDPYAELDSEFLEKIERIPDERTRKAYTDGIHELHRGSQRNPEKRDFFAKLNIKSRH